MIQGFTQLTDNPKCKICGWNHEEQIRAIKRCTTRLGWKFDPKTPYTSKKILQKLIYIMEMFGLDFGFRFKWYTYGPYSQHLTEMLYN